MTPEVLHLSTSLTAACAAGLWQGVAIAAVTAVLCGALRGAPAALRHTVLVLSFAAIVILPCLGLHRMRATSEAHGVLLSSGFALAIATLWLAATLVRAAQLGQAWLRLRQVRRRAIPVCVQGVERCVAGSRRAVLCSSPDVDAPTVIGFLSPQLLIPAWMVPALAEEELRQIALHECEHLRRGDDWLNLLLQMGLVIFPLNPALPWLLRTIRLQRELAVDEAVVARTAEPLLYATCLTRLAEQRRQHGQLRLALSAWSRKSELVQRVHALLQRSTAWSRMQSAWGLTGALVVLLGAGGLMVSAPQLVHVADAAEVATAAVPNSADAITPNSSALPLVRAVAVSSTGPTASPAAVAVQATFREGAVQPHRVPAAGTGKSRRKASRVSLVSNTFLQPRRTPAPRLMRMSYAVTPDASAQAEEAPVQVVPALFYTPYAAVPVSEGWLLITL